MESLLDRVPACFRLGIGWSVGGIRRLISRLGATFRLTAGDRAEPVGSGTIEEAGRIGHGSAAFSVGLPEGYRLANESQPAHLWAEWRRDFQALSRCSTKDAGGDAILPRRRRTTAQLFFKRVRRHHQKSNRQGGRIGPARTAWLLLLCGNTTGSPA